MTLVSLVWMGMLKCWKVEKFLRLRQKVPCRWDVKLPLKIWEKRFFFSFFFFKEKKKNGRWRWVASNWIGLGFLRRKVFQKLTVDWSSLSSGRWGDVWKVVCLQIGCLFLSFQRWLSVQFGASIGSPDSISKRHYKSNVIGAIGTLQSCWFESALKKNCNSILCNFVIKLIVNRILLAQSARCELLNWIKLKINWISIKKKL